MVSVSYSEKYETKTYGISSVDLQFLENVLMMKVVFAVNFIQVKQ